MRYWEDFQPGQVFDLGSYTMTARAIIDFAQQWDPQPFHVDPEAARHSSFGGLVASGWHTGSVFMRLYVDGVLADSASMGSPGLDELRWLAPVRPGDVLTAHATVLEVAESSKRPDRGTVHMRWEVRVGENTVMQITGRGLFGRRPAAI